MERGGREKGRESFSFAGIECSRQHDRACGLFRPDDGVFFFGVVRGRACERKDVLSKFVGLYMYVTAAFFAAAPLCDGFDVAPFSDGDHEL